MTWLQELFAMLLSTVGDVAPIVLVILGFQLFVLRESVPNPKRLAVGFFYVLLGMAFFLAGLEKALFPMGRLLASELTDPALLPQGSGSDGVIVWHHYYWVYLFAAAIGFATTIAEPSLIAVALKAEEISGGSVASWGLRIAVAVGVSVGITVGTFRIVTGTPLYYYIIAGYVVVMVQTLFAPRSIIALAYDSGGVTTSTVTVPVVAALGLGLAATVPGRNPIIDGFGLIAFASVFPIMAVLAYAQISMWLGKE